MKRSIVLFLLVVAFAATASADDLTGRTGIGGQLGIQKLVGGDHDYSNVDQNIGLWLRRGFSPRWSGELGVHYGWTRPGALQGEDAGFTFDSVHAFYTTQLTGFAGARWHLAPESRFVPYLGGRLGFMDWQVRDENGGDFGVFPGGPTVDGADENGATVPLEGTSLLASLTLGAEYHLSRTVALEVGARHSFLFGMDRDNVGSSALWGPAEADINTGRWEFFLGGTLWFGGSRDSDKDGLEDKVDNCPNEAEDFDGFRDEDGCPDVDNDGDGLWDADDSCPDDAEDLDGFQDNDGCPDPDNDMDGIIDTKDGCPDQAEDMDGFQDEDGCPDPDNDMDGVLDADDQCPDTPAGVEVDANGCPVVAEIKAEMVLEGVSFATNSDELTPESFAVLEKVVESLKAYPEVNIEIQGHTDSTGSAEYNLDISSRRAVTVRLFLVGRGIASSRLTAVGYGEGQPIADNGTREGRAANRRVELVRTN
ncbi:OmpA family protein [bacterium]|nr:OmpA family protein [bacterium]